MTGCLGPPDPVGVLKPIPVFSDLPCDLGHVPSALWASASSRTRTHH